MSCFRHVNDIENVVRNGLSDASSDVRAIIRRLVRSISPKIEGLMRCQVMRKFHVILVPRVRLHVSPDGKTKFEFGFVVS